MDNKQIIHIATEVITIIGLTIYFSRQNKKLYESIEVLTNSLNEQTEIIKKHEDIINNLLETVQRLISQQQIKQQPQNPHIIQQQPTIQPQNKTTKPQNSHFMKEQQYSHSMTQPQDNIQVMNPKIIFEEPQQQFIAFEFMQKPLSPKKSHKVEEIIEEEDDENIDEEDKKIVEEELLDDELLEELKELEKDE